MTENKKELKSKKDIAEEKRILLTHFNGFSKKFSFAFDNLKNQHVNWYYWGSIKGKKCKFYIVSRTKGSVFPERIINDENNEHNTKKLLPFKGRFGYFVLVFDGIVSIKDNLSYSFKIKKVYRKAKKKAAINLAHKIWWIKTYPDKQYCPFYSEEKRQVSDEKKEQMKERGKKLFQNLSERNKINCPRCEHVFSNFGKCISTHCPSCGTKFIVGEKKS